MRLNDLSDGSIKTLLIFGLLFANIAVAFSHRHQDAPPPESRHASRSVFSALAENFPDVHATQPLGEAPNGAREAGVLPNPLQP